MVKNARIKRERKQLGKKQVLDALDEDDFRTALQNQDWPTLDNPPKMSE